MADNHQLKKQTSINLFEIYPITMVPFKDIPALTKDQEDFLRIVREVVLGEKKGERLKKLSNFLDAHPDLDLNFYCKIEEKVNYQKKVHYEPLLTFAITHYSENIDYKDILDLFITHKANVNALDSYGRSALQKAYYNAERPDVVRMLLEAGASPDIQVDEQLLLKYDAPQDIPLKQRCYRYCLAPMFEITDDCYLDNNGKIYFLKLFLENGADPFIKDHLGQTVAETIKDEALKFWFIDYAKRCAPICEQRKNGTFIPKKLRFQIENADENAKPVAPVEMTEVAEAQVKETPREDNTQTQQTRDETKKFLQGMMVISFQMAENGENENISLSKPDIQITLPNQAKINETDALKGMDKNTRELLQSAKNMGFNIYINGVKTIQRND